MKIMNTKTKFLSVLFSALFFFGFSYSVDAQAAQKDQVYVGGIPFGIRFDAGEVSVLKTNEFISDGVAVAPARDAGIMENDIICSINGEKITTLNDVISSLNHKEGILDVTVKRGSKILSVKVTPLVDDKTGNKQIGVMLKDSSAGIGTITYVCDDCSTFAGLGHGICDAKSGELLKISLGYISDVRINDICKGKAGSPGELRGVISTERCGKLLSNTEAGVYGVLSDYKADVNDLIKIAEPNEVSLGKAYILCTLDNNKREKYDIEILQIDLASETKNFVIKVTDKRLLEKTGGIVQGMSGSPIIQNEKLVGAVTHVLINEPQKGYGIFIDNMLKKTN